MAPVTEGLVTDRASSAVNNVDSLRRCLICEEPTRYAHMEIDACRACAVFYRRLLERNKPLVCRTGLHNCETTRRGNLSCKMCRYDRFTAVLSESRKPRSERASHEEAASSISSSSSIEAVASQPSTSVAPGMDVLDRVRRGSTLMNAIRRASELSIRSNVPDEQGISIDGMVLIPATYSLYNQTMRILISAIYEFAATAFEEFKSMSHDEQWQLVQNFYPFVCVFDAEFRMLKFLPEEETMCFTSFTTYVDHDTLHRFLSGIPDTTHSEEGIKFLKEHLDGEVQDTRAKMRRWNPTEDEYIAYLGVCFWTLDKTNVSDKLHEIAENYRQLLFLELDKLYRNTMQLDDYASRMGDAMLIISSMQSCCAELTAKLGVLKLLDVVGDEMLLAQLHL